MENHHVLAEDHCPHCNARIDAHAHTGGTESMPVENDLSICFKCAGWSKYDKDLKLIPFTKEDREKTSPELLAEMEKYSDRVRFMNNSNN